VAGAFAVRLPALLVRRAFAIHVLPALLVRLAFPIHVLLALLVELLLALPLLSLAMLARWPVGAILARVIH
jgi:hypothetical protein